jgi:flagellar biosynthesis protein FlhA
MRAYFLDPATEQAVESAVEHGEQTSILTLSPAAIRELVGRIQQKVGKPDSPVVVIASSGSRHFLRQICEPSLWNVNFLSHNEVPPGVKVVSLGIIQ